MAWSINRKFKFFFISLAAIALAGFSWAVFFPTVGFKQDKAEEAFRQGTLLYTDYMYDAAIEKYLDSLAINPDFYLARRFLGQALYFSGQVDESLSEWKSILDAGVYDPPLRQHIQSLRSFTVDEEPNWFYSRSLPNEPGYRFQYPVFIGTLDDGGIFFLSIGGSGDAAYIEVSANGEYRKILRRISGKLEAPMGAAVGEKEIWITDFAADKIHRLSIDRTQPIPVINQLQPIGGPGSDLNGLRGPAGICYHNEHFWIVDSGNHRLLKYSEDEQKAIAVFSPSAAEISALQSPFGIACTNSGSIFVSESEAGRVSEFDTYGNYIRPIGAGEIIKPRHLSISQDTLIVADEAGGVNFYDMQGRKTHEIKSIESENPRNFLRPYSAVRDNFGNLFVADYAAHEIAVFHPENFMYTNLEVWIERVNAASFPNIGTYVTVKDSNGNYIRSLNENNFKILENDASVSGIRADYLEQFENTMTGIILFSRNQRMAEYNDSLGWLLDFAITNIRVKDKIKLASYAEDFRDESDYTNSKIRLRKAANDALQNLGGDGQAAGRALYTYLNELLPATGKRFLIWVIEGGLPAAGFQEYSMNRLENFAKNNHIPVFIFDFAHPDFREDTAQTALLSRFAEQTGGKRYSVFKDLKNIQEILRNLPENRYVLNFHSGANKEWVDRFMDLRIEVNFQGRKGIESSGYVIPRKK
ncbi:MAG: hypothetical protein KDK41_03360 [Leptospiraceae bacterium]|nr:hypothetical protein [Leptospiraceae bacterium]